MMHCTEGRYCEECGARLYQAGEFAPAGEYVRVDDGSFQRIHLPSAGVLPASFDGHIACYRTGAAPCSREQWHRDSIATGKGIRQVLRTTQTNEVIAATTATTATTATMATTSPGVDVPPTTPVSVAQPTANGVTRKANHQAGKSCKR